MVYDFLIMQHLQFFFPLEILYEENPPIVLRKIVTH